MLSSYGELLCFLAAAVGISNGQFRSYFLLAQALIGLNEVEKAREKLNQALEINPDYKTARELLSTISEES